MSLLVEPDSLFLDGVRRVAAEVAAPAADAADREARFPHEAVDALREERALSALVPRAHGGGGATFAEIAAACFELSRCCAAAGMVYAMHQIQVGCLVRHAAGAPFFDDYMDEIASEQRLLASATSEVGTGGDLRTSIAPLTPSENGSFVLEKNAPTVSYGAEADALLVTARRSPSAEPSDQVLVLARACEATLEQTGSWDSLGMRGTRSPGFALAARVASEQIVPVPFGEIAAQTMVPYSHLLWAHVWLGIATDAYDRARAFVRGQARGKPGIVPPAALRLSELSADLHRMRGEIAAATDEYEAMTQTDGDQDDGFTIGYAIRINNVKISASESAPRVCLGALSVCGMAGYKNDSPFGLGRHVRDSLSAALMIGNDRIHATNAALLLVHKAG